MKKYILFIVTLYPLFANAQFFTGGGWIYMIYEGADGWKMLTAPIHAYRQEGFMATIITRENGQIECQN